MVHNMIQLSAVIITYNEEKTIERCIKSLSKVADEIVVLDSFSTDKTEEICKRLGVNFYQHVFDGYRNQKNRAAQFAKNNYILSLDADEALSELLEASVLNVKKNWTKDAYEFNRLNNFCGQWLYHTDWYPDRKIRLYDRRKGEWGGLNIHEIVKMNNNATVGQLKGDLLHWTPEKLEDHYQKANKYSTLCAEEYYKVGKKVTLFKIITNPMWTFFKSYIIKRGFLDGFSGFLLSKILAHSNFQKYCKLRMLYKQIR